MTITLSSLQQGAGGATSIIAASISDGDTTHAPDGNSVFDALAGKLPSTLTLAVLNSAVSDADLAILGANTFTAAQTLPAAGAILTGRTFDPRPQVHPRLAGVRCGASGRSEVHQGP